MEIIPAYLTKAWAITQPPQIDDEVRAFAALFNWQANRCAMCGRLCEEQWAGKRVFRTGLVLDHDWTTNLFRGLLCAGCNISEGADTSRGQWAAYPWEMYRAQTPASLVGLNTTIQRVAAIMRRGQLTRKPYRKKEADEPRVPRDPRETKASAYRAAQDARDALREQRRAAAHEIAQPLYDDDVSLSEIARVLMAKGIVTVLGKTQWTSTQVSYLLRM